MEICTSHYKEDLEWLKKSEFPVTVVHHDGGTEFPKFKETYVIPNKGYEASAYLTFIIRRYDSLPEYTAFIHGHETADHQRVPCLLTAIRTTNIQKYPFVHLNNSWVYKKTEDADGFINKEKFKTLIDIPQVVYTSIGAQFIVHRDLIRKNSLEYYKKLLDHIETKNDAQTLEFTWHLIFGVKQRPSNDMFIPNINVYHLETWTVPDPEKFSIVFDKERDPSDPNTLVFKRVGENFKYLGTIIDKYWIENFYIQKHLYDVSYNLKLST